MSDLSELDRIEAEGAQLAGEMTPAAGLDATAPAGPTHAESVQMWAAIPATFGSILAMAMPELASVYTPAACSAWGEAMVPVARKYGWTSLDNLPEFTLVLVSLPFAIATTTAVKRRKKTQDAPAGTELVEEKGAAIAAAGPAGASPNAGVI